MAASPQFVRPRKKTDSLSVKSGLVGAQNKKPGGFALPNRLAPGKLPPPAI